MVSRRSASTSRGATNAGAFHAVANRRRDEIRRGPHGRHASEGDDFSFGRAGPLSGRKSPYLKSFTQFPPSLRSRDRIMHSLLVARGWISNRGDWLGPAKGRKGQGKGKQSPNESTGRTEYERLVQCPGSYISGSPIHRLAEELVVDEFDLY